jgi:hypothetical protein
MKKNVRSWIIASVSTLGVAWLGFVAYVDWAMHQPPEVFGHVMMRMPMPAYFLFPFETMWTQARHGQVDPGNQAPSFTLNSLETHEPVQMNSLWSARPVVLVFGSYT